MPKKEQKEPVEKTIITKVTKLPEESVKRAYILFLSGPLIGKLMHLENGLTTIGRAPDANIAINDSRISRHHLQIDVSSENVTIEDLGSTNGTFINGERVKKQKLADGDKIQISSTTVFKFALQDKTENIFHKELYKMAIIDPVTNIYNKRFFLERLKDEFSHAKRSKMGLSLLMIDIDFFKKVNDTHGHLAGDMLLHQLAKIIKSMVRGEDVLARYGGEEFVAILRGAKKDGAFNLAERIRLKVESSPLIFEEKKIPITISIGVASLDEVNEHSELCELIKDADEKLYQSKQNGRNRTTA
ncbi:MAG: diguanylate cyclase [Deltaproteobacteria bacterium]|nr:diguanylate cyclase [Deltaproteobacteria bacterium]MBI2974526.1 diguanylate cyclase [Deltaproteobacteria bacterium]